MGNPAPAKMGGCQPVGAGAGRHVGNLDTKRLYVILKNKVNKNGQYKQRQNKHDAFQKMD